MFFNAIGKSQIEISEPGQINPTQSIYLDTQEVSGKIVSNLGEPTFCCTLLFYFFFN